MDIEKLKARVTGEVDALQPQLSELALKIHAHPEVGLQEVQAAEWLTGYLEENGFSVERGIGDLATAFKARYGQGRPAIAFLAEYDALPGIGHACGHNLIATSAVGAGMASRPVIDQCGGSVLVIGTPSEELHGGKVKMANKGAFNDLDATMLVHPGTLDTAVNHSLAAQTLSVEFFGQSAHAAAHPEAGINALEALVLSFNAINSLRQHIRSSARIHGIILDGGKAPNVVPDHSAGRIIVRADDNNYHEELKQKVVNCCIGAATATGAHMEYRWSNIRYDSMRSNLELAQLFTENMQSLGRDILLHNPQDASGSSDMGNVSQLVPSVSAHVAIAEKGISGHTPQFAIAAASEDGIKGMLDGAKAMAMTAVDLLASPETVAKIREEFDRGK